MSEQPNLHVGSLVTARRTTGVCDAGERGVCYKEYQLEGRPKRGNFTYIALQPT